jgi:predicted CXXCH cytochrome family protein
MSKTPKKTKKENHMMRKYTLIFLILLLVLALATVASAEQPKVWDAPNDQWVYQATTEPYVPPAVLADPANNRIHSQYQKNTDACASCHATHTAVGASLLQWATIFDTCMACHDGTITMTYNVMAGTIGTGPGASRTSGGHFGGGASGSMHNVGAGLTIGAAPGGYPGGDVPEAEGRTDGDWGASFSCSSCHNPHGTGGNARILHPNPNRVNSEKTVTVGKNISTAGVSVATEVYAYYLLPDYAMRGFGYNFVVRNNGVAVPMTSYTVAVEPNTQNTVVTWKAGTAANAPATLTFIYTPSVRVTMDIQNYLASSESVEYVSGINDFCGACHRDYKATSGSQAEPVGIYSQAYRHPVGMLAAFNWELPDQTGLKFASAGGRQLVCLTCHVAHGSDEIYWQDTLMDLAYWDGSVATDFQEFGGAPSLKRIPNMGTCEACHQMGPANYGYKQVAQAYYERNKASYTAAALGDGYVGASNCGTCHDMTYSIQSEHQHTKKARPASLVPEWGTPQNPGPWYLAFETQYPAGAELIASSNTPKKLIKAEDIEFIFGDKWKVRFGIRHETAKAIHSDLTVTAGRDEGVLFMNAQYNTGVRGPNPADWIDPTWGTGFSTGSVWQRECIGCHTTGFNLDKYVADVNAMPKDAVTGAMNHIADYGITCEACHGPGNKHASAPSKANIVNPARLSINRQNDLCGACHARNVKILDSHGLNSYTAQDGTTSIAQVRQDPIPMVMLPGGKLLNAVEVNTGNLHGTSWVGTQHRMQWQELLGVPSNTSFNGMGISDPAGRQAWLANDSNRSVKGKVVSCMTCHDSHGYNASGYSLRQTVAANCAACHGVAMDLNTYMPWGVNSGNQRDIRTHIFNNARIATRP